MPVEHDNDTNPKSTRGTDSKLGTLNELLEP
jgi:hypothetical protein